MCIGNTEIFGWPDFNPKTDQTVVHNPHKASCVTVSELLIHFSRGQEIEAKP